MKYETAVIPANKSQIAEFVLELFARVYEIEREVKFPRLGKLTNQSGDCP